MERIPVIRIGDVLFVSIQMELEDQHAVALLNDLSEEIVKHNAHGVLIDISALEIVDSFVGRLLGTIAATSRILDASTVLVGMRPAVAITLVELGVTLPGVFTALNVDRGIELLRSRNVGR
jgi:rsbT antagonist protein RsbS